MAATGAIVLAGMALMALGTVAAEADRTPAPPQTEQAKGVMTVSGASPAIRATLRLGRAGESALAFSPDGTILAVTARGDRSKTGVGFDTILTLWHVKRGEKIGEAISKGERFAFGGDGTMLAVGGGLERSVHLLRVPQLTQADVLGAATAAREPILGIAFSPNGKMLAVRERDEVNLWDVARREVTKSLKVTADRESLWSPVAWSREGTTLAAAASPKSAILWNTKSWDVVAKIAPEESYPPHALAFSPDGRLLCTGPRHDRGGQGDRGPGPLEIPIRFWDAATGKLVNPVGYERSQVTGWMWHKGSVAEVFFSHDGLLLVTVVEPADTARIWDVASQKLLLEWIPEGEQCLRATFSPAERLLATCSGKGVVRLWDVDRLLVDAKARKAQRGQRRTFLWAPGALPRRARQRIAMLLRQ